LSRLPRADLRQLHGDARLGAPRDAGSGAGAVAAELFMTIIRGTQQPDGGVSGAGHVSEAVSGTGSLRVQAAEVFAADVAAGRVPSVRAIRSRLRVGQPRAQQVRAYLAALGDG
jgi:hypothetical protein